MLITNVLDYLLDGGDNMTDQEFHIPDSEFYEEFAMPFHIEADTGLVLDKNDAVVILCVYFLDSLSWELVDD